MRTPPVAAGAERAEPPGPEVISPDGARAEGAPAKLNLYLHVTGRREDGYHRLDSLVAFAGLGDVVRAVPAEELSLTIEGAFGPALAAPGEAQGNLVLKAARALRAAAGIEAGATLALEKNLPPASGLGGGSADAAATLRLLCRLWRIAPEKKELAGIARALGADVPACLALETAQMSGIGDLLRPAAALPKAEVLLVNPGLPLPTADVFRAFRGPFSEAAPLTEAPADAAELAAALHARRNDLEGPARALCPAIDEVLAALTAEPGALLARMSGSGATCFALFAERAPAEAAAAKLRHSHPAWWIETAPLLGT